MTNILPYDKCSNEIKENIYANWLNEWEEDFRDCQKIKSIIEEEFNGDTNNLYILVKETTFIGTVAIDFNNAYISHLFVVPAYRKKGFGKMLLKYAESILRKKEINVATLYCYYNMHNFYLNNGWQISNSITMGDKYAIVLNKNLN